MPDKNLTLKILAATCAFCIFTSWYFYGRTKKTEEQFKAKEAAFLKNEFELKNQISSLESLLKDKTSLASTLEEEKASILAQLESLKAENEKIKKAFSELKAKASQKSNVSKEIESFKKENLALKKKVDALENDPLIKRLRSAGGDKPDSAVRKILEKTLQDIQGAQSGEGIDLSPIVISKALKDLPPDIKQDMIYANAKIISVDPENSLAVINAGKKNNLEVNDSCIILNDKGEALGYGEIVSVRYQIAAVYIKKMQFDYKISDVKENTKVLIAKTAI